MPWLRNKSSGQTVWVDDAAQQAPSNDPYTIPSDPVRVKQQARENARQDQQVNISGGNLGISQNNSAREASNAVFQHSQGLKQDYNQEPSVKAYTAALPSFVSALHTDPNGAGDISLVYSYAKLMDPTTGVREGEQEGVNHASPIFDSIVAKLQGQLNGEGGVFSEKTRAALRTELMHRMKEMNSAYNVQRVRYEMDAKKNGVDPLQVIGPHVGKSSQDDIIKQFTPRNDKGETIQYSPELPDGLRGSVTDDGSNNGFFTGDYSPEALKHGLAEGAGSIAQGIGNVAGALGGNAMGTALYRAMGYDQNYDMGTALRNGLGLPQNPNQMSDAIIQGGTAALTGAGTAGAASRLATGATSRGVLNTLAAAPMRQMAGGAAAGGASELTREQGGGTAAQIGAGMVGGIVGGGLAGIRARSAAQSAIEGRVPSIPQLKQQAGALYRAAESRGVTATPEMTQQLSDDMQGVLRQEGRISPTGRISDVYPKAKEAAQLINDYAGQPMNPTQMQTVRNVMTDGLTSSEPKERRLARLLTDTFDDWSSPQAPELAQARDVSSRYINAQHLERARELANVEASKFSGSGSENALRTQYRGLDRNAVKGNGNYGEDLNKAIQNVSRGTPASNTARALGRLAPTGVVSFGLGSLGPAALATSIGGPGAGAAVGAGMAGLGTVGRLAATSMGQRGADVAELVARNGGAIRQAPLIDPETEQAMAAVLATQYANGSGMFGKKKNRR